MVELQKVEDVRPGNPEGSGKRKRSSMEMGRAPIWSQMMSLWKLLLTVVKCKI